LFKRNTIKYRFCNNVYNEKHIAEELVKDIIVKSTPTTSCWWSKLKRRTDKSINDLESKKNKQEYILEHDTEPEGGGSTAKTCSGILNLFSRTYLIKSPTDIVITMDSKDNYRWDVGEVELVVISKHNKKQFWSEGNELFGGKACFKICIKVRLSTSGFGYMLVAPQYHNELGLDVALGYISNIYAKSEQLNIFIFMDVPKEGETSSVTIPKGTVLQYLIPDVKSKLTFGKKRFVEDLLDNGFSNKRKH
jgi:hypothetical protein